MHSVRLLESEFLALVSLTTFSRLVTNVAELTLGSLLSAAISTLCYFTIFTGGFLPFAFVALLQVATEAKPVVVIVHLIATFLLLMLGELLEGPWAKRLVLFGFLLIPVLNIWVSWVFRQHNEYFSGFTPFLLGFGAAIVGWWQKEHLKGVLYGEAWYQLMRLPRFRRSKEWFLKNKSLILTKR